jgi:catechol 2,3-dioxygenase-like lactoylglutathione lyase family enzyme
MIGYVTIGVSDMEKAYAFYDGLFGELGGKQMFGQDRIKFYGTGRGQPMVAICVPYDQQAQHPGNGNMLALPVKRDDIDRVYRKALELGATDEGEPGERLPVFYGAYIRDPDGNKICFYEMTF